MNTKSFVRECRIMRLPTGIEGFDDLLDGGLPEGRLYVVGGPPGSGKTTFCAQFLAAGGDCNEKGVYLSMHEPIREFVSDMSRFNFGLSDQLQAGRVMFVNIFDEKFSQLLLTSRSENAPNSIKSMTNRLVSFLESQEVDRLVIDSTLLLEYYFSDKLGVYVEFMTALQRADVTAILISELSDPTAYTDIHHLAHGVVFLYHNLGGEHPQRGVQIIKMNGTQVDGDIHKLRFTPEGLQVDPDNLIDIH